MMRILLADDQPDVRSALRLLLEQEVGQWEVCGEAEDARGVFEQTAGHPFDLVLIDWELPGLHPGPQRRPERSGGQALSALRSLHPSLVVVALSGRVEAQKEASTAGADLFISKSESPERLLQALRQLCQSLSLQ
jgi:DNA-binding NarL/FixJ family response regulator